MSIDIATLKSWSRVNKGGTRASIVYDNILRLLQDSLRSTLTGHFQYRENDKKMRNSPRNNKFNGQ